MSHKAGVCGSTNTQHASGCEPPLRQPQPHGAHLPADILEPKLLADGDELLAVQVAVSGDAEVLTDLLQFLLYPLWCGQRGTRRGVQVIWVPETQLP